MAGGMPYARALRIADRCARQPSRRDWDGPLVWGLPRHAASGHVRPANDRPRFEQKAGIGMVARPISAAATLGGRARARQHVRIQSRRRRLARLRVRPPLRRRPSLKPNAPLNDRLRRQIEQMRARPEGSRLPAADSFTVGPRAITATAPARGQWRSPSGSLDVSGRLDGSAYVINGDIVVHERRCHYW